MTDYEKTLIFTIAGGIPENFPLIHQIHTGYIRGVQMLEVCKSQGIIGLSFRQLWMDKGGKSKDVASFLLKKLNRDSSRKLHIKDLK